MRIIFDTEEKETWLKSNRDQRRKIMDRMLDLVELFGKRDVSFEAEDGNLYTGKD